MGMINEDTSDWYAVMVRDWESIPDEWIKENIRDGWYMCFGYYWYFEREIDAIMFRLKWG